MAKYRQLMVRNDIGWNLMSPSNPWEALRIAWMLWRHPDRVAALVGVKQEYTPEHWNPYPACDEPRFRLFDGGRKIIDGDFIFDTLIYVQGDFADEALRTRYAQWMCDALNEADKQLPREPSGA